MEYIHGRLSFGMTAMDMFLFFYLYTLIIGTIKGELVFVFTKSAFILYY